MKVQNPIIRGFYPDPSICKANGKYYLACSSFQYFPSVPLFESKDLVNWKQIGHCLTRASQIDLRAVPSSGGVFAPTLRFHEGIFYMVTNNNTCSQNFYVCTDDIYGEWSEPIFVEQQGIDPSLLFDGEKVYFTSNGKDKEGKPCILQCEIDRNTGKKLSDTVPIWHGSGGRYLEAPHLYHIGRWYYLMAAEGGTEYGHMITYARAENPYGPFEGYQSNPVLTNRDIGGDQNRIQGIGHGDLIEVSDGEYCIVCLGFRQSGIWQAYHHLGREVFLEQVHWQENGWFTAGEEGRAREWIDLEVTEQPKENDYDLDFEIPVLENPRWCYLRNCEKENYCFENRKLYLRGTDISLNEIGRPTFIGVRQSEFYTYLYVEVEGDAKESGITFYMDECQHYDLFYEQEEGAVALRIHVGDAEQIVGKLALDKGEKAILEVVSDNENYRFYGSRKGERHFIGKARTKYLSSEVAGGFTGVLMGLYVVDARRGQACFSKLNWIQRKSPFMAVEH